MPKNYWRKTRRKRTARSCKPNILLHIISSISTGSTLYTVSVLDPQGKSCTIAPNGIRKDLPYRETIFVRFYAFFGPSALGLGYTWSGRHDMIYKHARWR